MWHGKLGIVVSLEQRKMIGLAISTLLPINDRYIRMIDHIPPFSYIICWCNVQVCFVTVWCTVHHVPGGTPWCMWSQWWWHTFRVSSSVLYLYTIPDNNYFYSNLCTPSGEERAAHQDYSEKRRQQVSLLIYSTTSNGSCIVTAAAVRPSVDGGVASFCINQTERVWTHPRPLPVPATVT